MSSKSLHVHLENVGSKAPVFHMTEAVYRAAARRHAALARRVKVTIGWDGDKLAKALATADVYVGSNPPARDGLRERAPRLKLIHATGAGVDQWFPLDWLPRDVAFTNSSGVHRQKAFEFATMAFVMLNDRMPQIFSNQRSRRWQQIFTTPAEGKTAVVIGLGDMGEAAARAARRLGIRVIGVRRSGKGSRYADKVVKPAQLDRVLPEADFVVVATPLTAETRNLLDARRLDLLQQTAGLLNIARAAVVDYDALCQRLAAGRLAGAILDVFPKEPLPAASPLWDTPNLLITPHVSSDDAERYMARTMDLMFDNLDRLLAGKPLRNRVNRTRGY
jgi:phosphoglycerate dehydrogenase-like enzyme